MSKVIATDLDGTLFYPKQLNRCIPKKNIKFLREWIDNGNRLVLVTSRSYQFLRRLEKEIDRPIDLIATNSSQIIVQGESIRDVKIDKNEIKEVIEYISKEMEPVAFLATTKNYPIIIKDNKGVKGILSFLYKLWHFFQFKYREDYLIDNKIFDDEIENGHVYKVMVFYGFKKKNNEKAKEINKFLREKFPNIESAWSSIVNELTPVDCDKGAGLEYYSEHLGIKPNDIYVVGDSGNDITMFNKFHDNSYCMSHAYPGVKKYAKHTITRIYKLKKDLLKGEKHESK